MFDKSEIDRVRAEALCFELQPAKHGRGVYVCPACGREKVYKPTAAGIWYCQRCRERGSVFDVVRLRDGVTHERAFMDVMNRYSHGQTIKSSSRGTAAAMKPAVPAAAGDSWRAECRRYCLAAAAALPGSPGLDYMRGRGFNDDTLKRFRVGYDARARVHGVLKYGRAAVVYPYGRDLGYYGVRFLKPITAADGDIVKTMKPTVKTAGNEPLFNSKALQTAYDTVIVTEGPFDAMSIAQGAAILGANVGALAICGTNGRRLVDELTEKPTAARLLVALDNDDAGRAGAAALASSLDEIGQPFEIIDSAAAWAGLKDANELLQADSAVLVDAIDFLLNAAEARL